MTATPTTASRRMLEVPDAAAVEVLEFRGAVPGSTLSVLGGVHGDELEGVIAARMLAVHLDELLRRDPGALAGTVRVVPVANPDAFAARVRCNPVDGANLARVFPGDLGGRPTERIAAALTAEVIAGADLLVDLHSAGELYSMPVFAGCFDIDGAGGPSCAAARAFGADIVWFHDSSNPGRSLSAANDLGVPAIYVEGSGGGSLVGRDLDTYVGGLARILSWLGITDPVSEELPPRWRPRPVSEPIVLRGADGDVDAAVSATTAGYFVGRVHAGAVVQGGDVLGEVIDEEGRVAETVLAPTAGTVMLVRRRAEVSPGDGLAMFGPVPERSLPGATR